MYPVTDQRPLTRGNLSDSLPYLSALWVLAYLENSDAFTGLLRRNEFDRHSKGFSYWQQFVAMVFCQLAQAKSLREISQGLPACLGKLNHFRIHAAPKRSALS